MPNAARFSEVTRRAAPSRVQVGASDDLQMRVARRALNKRRVHVYDHHARPVRHRVKLDSLWLRDRCDSVDLGELLQRFDDANDD